MKKQLKISYECTESNTVFISLRSCPETVFLK